MRQAKGIAIVTVLVFMIGIFLAESACNAAETVQKPKEFGVYAKTDKGLKRIVPNIVSDADGIYYLEPNNPQTFRLGQVDYFLIYGDYEINYITLNPMKPFMVSPLGTTRVMFGKDIDITVTKKEEKFYTVKVKGLFGRGYYAIWIADAAWDFVIE